MFNTAFINKVSTTATVFVGTAFLGLAGLGIANPAQAETPAQFRQSVEASIANTIEMPAYTNGRRGVATVAVSIAADGSVRSATLVGTSGTKAFDAEALRTARSVAYPATDKARSVAMVLGFGKHATAADAARGKALVAGLRSDSRRMLASDTTAQPVG